MHNLTPLGMLMHLKDLDRQAVPKLRPLRSQRRDSAGANAVGIAVIALVRRLHALGIAWRVVKQSLPSWPASDQRGGSGDNDEDLATSGETVVFVDERAVLTEPKRDRSPAPRLRMPA